MKKLEDERILKYCGLGQWLRSHIKFIRAGDRFKIGEERFLATGDPYFYEPPGPDQATIRNIARGMPADIMDPIKPIPGWTIKFIPD